MCAPVPVGPDVLENKNGEIATISSARLYALGNLVGKKQDC
jgi:hypothetical protein